jgi:hypothetical protein
MTGDREGVREVVLPGDYRIDVPVTEKKAKKLCINEDEYYGFGFPANGGAYGAARRKQCSKLETQRAIVSDAVAAQLAESCIAKGREHFKGAIPEESVFEASYKLPGLPPCRVIVAFTEGTPLQLVKLYPDFRESRLVYVFVGNCGPYAVL